MSAPSEPQGAIGPGRARPSFEPRSLQCPHCGSPLTAQDERTRLIICPACNSQVELTASEARVLGERSGLEPHFRLPLGQSLTFDGHRYEVSARLSYSATDDDFSDPRTHMYLLYSPRRGSLWLSMYSGQWDLSWASHLAPRQLPFHERRIQTFDGRAWRVTETGTGVLEWVDGALPYVAQVGDRWDYAECSGPGNSTYEVTRTADELEFGEGRTLKPSELYEALGDADKADEERRRERRNRPVPQWMKVAFVLAALAVLLGNAFVLLTTTTAGAEVLQMVVQPSDFDRGDVISQPFTLQGGLVDVQLEAPGLSNAWVAVDVALLKADEEVVLHVDDADLQYYSGYEGGESWSEGSRSTRSTWNVPEAGMYRLMVRTLGNRGEVNLAGRPTTAVAVRVSDGARAWWWAGFGTMLGLATTILGLLALFRSRS